MGLDIGSIVGGATSGLVGLALEGHNDERQRKQQQELTDIQIKGQKNLNEHQKALDFDMWNKTNAAAQVKHLKDAGLNVGLMYGGSGAGGATTGGGSGGGVTGGSAPAGGREIMDMAMLKAQMDNIKADTEKKKVEAGKIGGVDTDLGKTQIASLTQGIENAKAQEALTRVQTSIGELDMKLKDLSMDDALDLIAHTARKADSEANIAFNEAYVSGETRDTKVNIMRAELIGTTLRNILTKAQTQATNAQTEATKKSIEVSDAQIKQMSESIAQGWAGLGQGESKIAIDKFKEEVKANYPSIMNTAGRLLDSTVDGIFRIGGRVRRIYNKID